MSVEIKILPVYQGDSILLFFNKRMNCIMIDTGTRRSYTKGILKETLKEIDKIDLLVLTHTDEDHIGGILKYYEDSQRNRGIFKKIWFNSGSIISNELGIESNFKHSTKINNDNDLNVSLKQGKELEYFINEEGVHFKKVIKSLDTYNLNFSEIIVISPDIEDLGHSLNDWDIEDEKSLNVTTLSDHKRKIADLNNLKFIEKGTLANKTSIALIVETEYLKLMFLGDSFPSVIVKNLRMLGYNEENKLKLSIVKISHHGSNFATSPELLKIIDCTNFVISSNASNNLPTKECLARIVTHRIDMITIYFNYKNETTESIFFKEELTEYNFQVKYLTMENNYTINLE